MNEGMLALWLALGDNTAYTAVLTAAVSACNKRINFSYDSKLPFIHTKLYSHLRHHMPTHKYRDRECK